MTSQPRVCISFGHRQAKADIWAVEAPEPDKAAVPAKSKSKKARSTAVDNQWTKDLEKRAGKNNCADSGLFGDALIWNFVSYDEDGFTKDELGALKRCTQRCGICGKGRWTYVKDSTGGSTTNARNHMIKNHGAIWDAALRAENRAMGRPEGDPAQPSVADLMTSVSHGPPKLDSLSKREQSFSMEVAYEKLIKWMVISNQPFSEIENDEFLDLITYLRPAIEGKVVKADAIKNRIDHKAHEHRGKLAAYLKVQPAVGPVHFRIPVSAPCTLTASYAH